MTLFEFLLAMNGWQWFGLIILCGVIAEGLGRLVRRRS